MRNEICEHFSFIRTDNRLGCGGRVTTECASEKEKLEEAVRRRGKGLKVKVKLVTRFKPNNLFKFSFNLLDFVCVCVEIFTSYFIRLNANGGKPFGTCVTLRLIEFTPKPGDCSMKESQSQCDSH